MTEQGQSAMNSGNAFFILHTFSHITSEKRGAVCSKGSGPRDDLTSRRVDDGSRDLNIYLEEAYFNFGSVVGSL
jgi:hypothetical protein